MLQAGRYLVAEAGNFPLIRVVIATFLPLIVANRSLTLDLGHAASPLSPEPFPCLGCHMRVSPCRSEVRGHGGFHRRQLAHVRQPLITTTWRRYST
ncbi:hypothetical protein QBC46DRAFT_387908 [Diplogelasinospora grovesii]|uniref:Uncharacterized protein n=1 Tax=Diplogelasinospora grovesii TaxID=303347 RepID=A0AAN6N5A6_9PEZI|nr:hypothetical protein QBC46DRAFT_387908 [Diplogelasinospora grovesii]